MDDPDATEQTWTHWLAYDIPSEVRDITENQLRGIPLTNGGLQGLNSWGNMGYGGPCPPAGTTHTYRLSIYALDSMLLLPPGATEDELILGIESHFLANILISGTYSR